MNALPLELRRRIVEAYERREGTYFELAQRFGVGEATVYRLLRLKRERGDVGMGAVRGIREEELPQLVQLVSEIPGATLEQLKQAWISRTGRELSLSCVARALRRAGISRRKPSDRHEAAALSRAAADAAPLQHAKKRRRVG